MYSNHNSLESGNVLIYILIAVVLFAALSFAFTQTQQGGEGAKSTMSEGKASLTASEIMDFVNDVDKTVTRFKTLNDCDPANKEVSFDVPSPASGSGDVPADSNTTPPKCHVFYSDGGGINANKLADDGSDNPRDFGLVYLSSGSPPLPIWYGATKMPGVGTSTDELVFSIGIRDRSVCQKINDSLLDNNSVPKASNVAASPPSYIKGEMSYCIEADGVSYNYDHSVWHVIEVDGG